MEQHNGLYIWKTFKSTIKTGPHFSEALDKGGVAAIAILSSNENETKRLFLIKNQEVGFFLFLESRLTYLLNFPFFKS